MQELIEKFGINWKLLLAQVANFLVLLLVLRFTVYKPLIGLMAARRHKIEKGLREAEEARKHLDDVEAAGRVKIGEVEKESLAIIARAQNKAKASEEEILQAAKIKEHEIMQNAARLAEVKKKESEMEFYREAVGVIKAAIIKTAELSPAHVDEALIKEGLAAAKKSLPRA